ncbi:2'-5' RNA ligase family protein [Muricoccus radiodurans]|uniref:2'-5' RNA ligase family protein n=1 Tax=Muricoccus radiodurans TaxID=2231721 RepID=UPI003CF23316
MEAPLIVTLRFDAESFGRLDALRTAHFPPERNVIPAHLTLFHALPGAEEAAIAEGLAVACRASPVMRPRIAGLRSLGGGTAFVVEAPDLTRMRKDLAARWAEWLTRQDSQPWRPHVTIQNKVAPDAARALLEALRRDFHPWEATGEGLLLWRYRGGPWEAAGFFPFGA